MAKKIINYIEGNQYQLDAGFQNTSVVTLISHGKLFCTICNEGGAVWDCMLNRLTEIKETEEK